MRVKYRRRIYYLALGPMGTVGGILWACASGTALAQKDHRRPGVRLEVGSYLSGGVTTTAFVLTNGSREPFRTTPICTNYNRLVIVSPDGKQTERFSWKKGIAPVVVGAGESKVWSLSLAETPEFKEPGTYRMTWKIGEAESDETVVVREDSKKPDGG